MSFKFVPLPADDLPDDEALLASEEDLPADFAALGEQLQVDALRLGSVYPACRPPLELIDALAAKPRRASVWRWVAGGSVAAATILLITGLAIVANSQRDNDPRVAESSGTPANNAAAAPADTTAFVQAPLVRLPDESTNRLISNPTSRAPVQPISYRPAVTDVNGPQLEGLLDLWNEQPQAGATVAF
ncbi:hypothetical protein NA78x_006019 [Anatilimnocola sp. NA78]|uniref:hypothetical protein n=1 Tax=Anatilimnocola sp. NA78 TaxID=3415683 RepID=UPI003CE4CF1F